MNNVTPGDIRLLLDRDAIKEMLYELDCLSDNVDRSCRVYVRYTGGEQVARLQERR